MVSDQQLRDSRLVFYRNDLTRLDKVLGELVRLSAAKSVLLIDKEGHLITEGGQPATFDADTISALVAGSFSATREMARILGERQFTSMNHQGEHDSIQLSLVGDRTILTVIFDDTTTLGMVRLYVNEAVKKLERLFHDIEVSRENGVGGPEPDEEIEEEFGDSAKDKLDQLFG